MTSMRSTIDNLGQSWSEYSILSARATLTWIDAKNTGESVETSHHGSGSRQRPPQISKPRASGQYGGGSVTAARVRRQSFPSESNQYQRLTNGTKRTRASQ